LGLRPMRARERESQVVECRNWLASGPTSESYTINLGPAPESLHRPSRAAPSGNAG
jgi:hypothetical protein